MNREKTINPEMVILARESRGLTQRELAERLSVSPGWLSRVEGGLRGVQDMKLRQLSEVLDYPVDFFVQKEPIYGLGITEVFHRKRRIVAEKTLNKIYSQINIRRINLIKMLRGVEMGEINISPIHMDEFDGKAKDVARLVRARWHLPHGPIQNLMKAFEDARGIVISMDFGTNTIDAISYWPPDTPPLFFVNAYSASDRLRFTLCHELGHIIMHQDAMFTPDMEKQADEFAAEFLMPEIEIRPYLTDLSLEKLATLKQFWKVSMAALLKRATDLGVITHRQSRTLWMQMGKAGYRTREPVELDLPVEKPSLEKEIVNTYIEDMGYTISELGKLLCLSTKEVMDDYIGSEQRLRDKERRAIVGEAERIIKSHRKKWGE